MQNVAFFSILNAKFSRTDFPISLEASIYFYRRHREFNFYCRPHPQLMGDGFHWGVIGDPSYSMETLSIATSSFSAAQILIGNPELNFVHPNIFIGDPKNFISNTMICIGESQFCNENNLLVSDEVLEVSHSRGLQQTSWFTNEIKLGVSDST